MRDWKSGTASDVPRPQLIDQAHVLPRQAVADAVRDAFYRAPAQDSEALARRAPEQQGQLTDPDAGPLQQVMARDITNVPAQRLDAEVRRVGGGGVTVDLNRTDHLEPRLLESERSAATPGKDVGNRVTPGHAAPRFPGCRAAQRKTSARTQNRPRRGPRSTTGRGKSWYLFMYVDTLLRWRRPSRPATSVASTRSPGSTSGTL